jgi:hypothetical protein
MEVAAMVRTGRVSPQPRNAHSVAQLNEVLQDAGVYDSTQLVVVAGDLNLNASKSVITDALARAGFRDVVPTSGVPTTPARHLLETRPH